METIKRHSHAGGSNAQRRGESSTALIIALLVLIIVGSLVLVGWSLTRPEPPHPRESAKVHFKCTKCDHGFDITVKEFEKRIRTEENKPDSPSAGITVKCPKCGGVAKPTTKCPKCGEDYIPQNPGDPQCPQCGTHYIEWHKTHHKEPPNDVRRRRDRR